MIAGHAGAWLSWYERFHDKEQRAQFTPYGDTRIAAMSSVSLFLLFENFSLNHLELLANLRRGRTSGD